jgi:hypothetical protein
MSVKPEFQSDIHEFETRDVGYGKALRATRMVESVRLGLTTLALLAGLTIVGTSAETLAVYNKTHLGQDFLLPLWPSDFDIRPTIALVACGSITFLASAASLIASKVQAVSNNRVSPSSVLITNVTQPGPEQTPRSQLGLHPRFLDLLHRRADRYVLLLWSQRLVYCLFSTSLDLPVVRRLHDHCTTLGKAMQGEQSGLVSNRHDRTAGSFGIGGHCLGCICREEAIRRPRKEG